MKFLICKTCGYVDLTSSDTWEVTRPGEDAELNCPECKGKQFLKMELSIKVNKNLEEKEVMKK